MICCQFFDAGPWVHGSASNVSNLFNLRNLRFFTSSESGPKHENGLLAHCSNDLDSVLVRCAKPE
jgi:hypothetical protein